jgi:hypothetical protein
VVRSRVFHGWRASARTWVDIVGAGGEGEEHLSGFHKQLDRVRSALMFTPMPALGAMDFIALRREQSGFESWFCARRFDMILGLCVRSGRFLLYHFARSFIPNMIIIAINSN